MSKKSAGKRAKLNIDIVEAIRLAEQTIRCDQVYNTFLASKMPKHTAELTPGLGVLADAYAEETGDSSIKHMLNTAQENTAELTNVRAMPADKWCNGIKKAFRNKAFSDLIRQMIVTAHQVFWQQDPRQALAYGDNPLPPEDDPFVKTITVAHRNLVSDHQNPRWLALALFCLGRLIGSNATRNFSSDEWSEVTFFWFDAERALLSGDGDGFANLLLTANRDYFEGEITNIIGNNMLHGLAEMTINAGDKDFFHHKLKPEQFPPHQEDLEEDIDEEDAPEEDAPEEDTTAPFSKAMSELKSLITTPAPKKRAGDKYGLSLIEAYMADVANRHPDVWKNIDFLRARRGNGVPHFPDWCFCPQGLAQAAIGGLERDIFESMEDVVDMQTIPCFSAWRTGKGIYTFDPEIYDAISETPISGDLPIDLLYRLPEYCIYIPVPEERTLKHTGFNVSGFFAFLDVSLAGIDDQEAPPRLCFLLLLEGFPYPLTIGLNLVGGSLENTLNSYLDEGLSESGEKIEPMGKLLQALTPGSDMSSSGLDFARASMMPGGQGDPLDFLSIATSLVLYLCADNSDMTSNGVPRRPGKPKSKKTKKGIRMFPAPKNNIWEMGYRIGAALRAARQGVVKEGVGETTGRKVSAHTRRAHWHTYLVGKGSKTDPSKGQRILKWLPPTLVGVENLDDLIPTVRPVKKKR